MRHHGDVARIEVSDDDMPLLLEKALRREIAVRFRELGYVYTAIDAEGYRTGSMNKTILKAGKP